MKRYQTTIMFFISFNLKDLPRFLTHLIIYSNAKTMFILLLICLILLRFVLKKNNSCKVYLIDFACYKPPKSQKCSKELVLKQAIQSGYFSKEMLDFMKIILERSGLGDSTYLADIFFGEKYNPSMKDAKREVEMTVFGAVDMLLQSCWDGMQCRTSGNRTC